MSGLVDLFQFGHSDMSIDGCRLQIAMAEHRLHKAHVGPILQHRCRHGVPKYVASSMLTDTRPHDVFAHHLREPVRSHGATFVGQEQREMRRLARHMTKGPNGDTAAISRLAHLQEQVLWGERRTAELTEAMVALRRQQVTAEELARVAQLLDGPWPSMSRADQTHVLRQLLQRIDCEAGKITIAFNATGTKAVAEELAQ